MLAPAAASDNRETLAELPFREADVVEMRRFPSWEPHAWIPAFAGMTVVQGYPFAGMTVIQGSPRTGMTVLWLSIGSHKVQTGYGYAL